MRVGFVMDGLRPRWDRPWQLLRGCPSDSAVGQMRFGWIARECASTRRACYEVFKPWQRYDAVVFLKSMNGACQRLAADLRDRGTRVLFDVNVDYFTAASGTFQYRGMAPTAQQTEDAHRMASLCDALIADSSHLARICAAHHPRVRWISDNVDMRLAPPPQKWALPAKLDLLWSGEAVKLFELLKIEPVLRRFASRVRLVLITSKLTALDRWFEPLKAQFSRLLADVEHTIVPFRSIAELLEIYARGGVCIAPRFLENSYNLGHTEWKIALPMACGRVAFCSPVPSYEDVAGYSAGRGLRICKTDEEWSTQIDAVLTGRFDFANEEAAARAVIAEHYSTPVVASAHADFVGEVCGKATTQ